MLARPRFLFEHRVFQASVLLEFRACPSRFLTLPFFRFGFGFGKHQFRVASFCGSIAASRQLSFHVNVTFMVRRLAVCEPFQGLAVGLYGFGLARGFNVFAKLACELELNALFCLCASAHKSIVGRWLVLEDVDRVPSEACSK